VRAAIVGYTLSHHLSATEVKPDRLSLVGDRYYEYAKSKTPGQWSGALENGISL
jgi:hypothetical protein